MDRKERPAYVRFERVPVEDKAASLRDGHYVAKDIDYVLVTAPYSKDIFKQKVTSWLSEMKVQIQSERMSPILFTQYQDAYKAWLAGQEIPLHGSPIKGWGVLSPAQQETLIHSNILTVEDLAGITDEGIRRVGMGAVDLKKKANSWLAQMNDKGPLTLQMAAIEGENSLLKANVATLTGQVEELMKQVRAQAIGQPVAVPSTPPAPEADITASDIMDDSPALAMRGSPAIAEDTVI
jgi:hypothetical protein